MRTSLLLSLSLAALAAAPRAQSVYALQGPIARVIEMSGPPSGACGYPDGPQNSSFVYPQPAPCLGVGNPVAFVPGAAGPAALMGDIAVDKQRDVVFVTDGVSIAAYKASTGVMLGNIPFAFLGIAPPLTGLGFDGNTGFLWMCNVAGYAALQPNGTCAPVPQLGFTAAPAGVGALSDIDMDPATGQLWVCDAGGNVAHFAPGAAVPVNLIGVAGGLPCGVLGIPFTGLCIDSSSPPGTFIVTDGVTVARLAEAGLGVFGPPVPHFGLPQNCWPVPAAPAVQGLAFAARPASYGVGAFALDALGECVVPNPNFTLVLNGPPVGLGAFIVDFGAACPALGLAGAPAYLAFTPLFTLIGPFPVVGNMSFAAALPGPGVLPPGLTIHLQAFVDPGAGPLISSNALALTIALP
jgi:hypothetical protein